MPPEPALDLDGTLGSVGPPGQQVEARPIGQAGVARLVGLRHVADGRARGFLVGACDPDGNGLDGDVVPAAFPRVRGGLDEGVGDQDDAARDDAGRFRLQRGEAACLLRGQPALFRLDPVQLRSGAGVAPAVPFGEALPPGEQLRGLVIVAAGGPVAPSGQAALDFGAVGGDQPRQCDVVQPRARRASGRLPGRASGAPRSRNGCSTGHGVTVPAASCRSPISRLSTMPACASRV